MKTSTFLAASFAVVFVLVFCGARVAYAAPAVGVPVTVTQPDGAEVQLFATGDEYYNWLHDADGYTVIQSPDTGYYVYADLVGGELVPTDLIAGIADPAAAGLSPRLNISPERRTQIRQEFLALSDAAGPQNAPSSGTITNLVVFIRFSDEAEFTQLASTYTGMLNTGANSLKSYFLEASYGQLTIDSALFPTPGTTIVSYQDSYPRSYYQPYNSVTNPDGYPGGDNGPERRLREHGLLRDAVSYVSSQVPYSGDALDADGDGWIDDMTFIVSGSPNAWASLLWPHAWALYTTPYASINGKYVWDYNFQMQSMVSAGVLAHETFHVVGAPDLYHYSYDGFQPVGGWDLMEYDSNPPQHMGCYMKYKYGGWLSSIPEITVDGIYTLNPLASGTSDVCFKIASPNSASEYFVVEYRRAAGTFESSLPASGMLVYRINTAVGEGNAEGPPDEVYLYRPGGTPSANGSVNQAYFSAEAGRTSINDFTNPSSFLTSGSAGGLKIDSVSSAGATISFRSTAYALQTLTVTSQGAYDGTILESSETSSKGGIINPTATTFTLGDCPMDYQYRGILSFDTHLVPDKAVITRVTLKLKKRLQGGADPFTTHGNIVVDIRKGTFGNLALESSDFQSAPSTGYKSYAASIKSSPISWFSANLASSVFQYVNKTGTTQLRLRFTKDDDDDRVTDYITFYSGNYSSATPRPTLVIEYYIPTPS